MQGIIFEATYLGKRSTIKVSKPSGGAESYNIYINDYYQGTIRFLRGEWVSYLNNNSKLTEHQLKRIAERLEEAGYN